MMKKLFCAVLLIALTLAVAACGTGEEIISDAEAVKIENYADISISVLNLALVIIATWIAIVQHRRNSYDRREENLKKTLKDLTEYLQDNYEGQVFIKELSEDMVKQFRDSHRSTPAFRQIMSIVLDHPDSFGVRP